MLDALLDPAVPDSRLVIVRGGSPTGKLWDALAAHVLALADLYHLG